MADKDKLNEGAGPQPVPSPDAQPKQRKIRARRSRKLEPAPPPKGQQVIPPQEPMELALPGARDAALRRLGAEKIPFRVNLSMALHPAGGMKQVMEEIVPLLALVDQRYRRLLEIWNTTGSGDKSALFPEDFLFIADINPADFVGEVARAAFRMAMDAGVLMAAKAHSEILKTSLELAQSPIGLEDRKLHFKATGYTPLPKGSQIVIQQNNSGSQTGGPNSGEQGVALKPFEGRALDTSKAMEEAEDAEFEEVPEKED